MKHVRQIHYEVDVKSENITEVQWRASVGLPLIFQAFYRKKNKQNPVLIILHFMDSRIKE